MTRREKASVDAAHQTHDRLLIARFAASDLDAPQTAAAETLVSRCPECAALAGDLRYVALATAALPTPSRPRDFRLTPEQAAGLGGSAWQRFLARLAAPRMAVLQPLASAAVAIGLVLVVVGNGSPGQPAAAPAHTDDTRSPMASNETRTMFEAAPEAAGATPSAASEPEVAATDAAAASDAAAPATAGPSQPAATSMGWEGADPTDLAPAYGPGPGEAHVSAEPDSAMPTRLSRAAEPSPGDTGSGSAQLQSPPPPTEDSDTELYNVESTPVVTAATPEPASSRTGGVGQALMLLGGGLAGMGVLLIVLRLFAQRTVSGH